MEADKRPKQPDALTLCATRKTPDGKYIVEPFGFGETPDGLHYVTCTSQIVHWRDTYGMAGHLEIGGQECVALCFPGMNMAQFLDEIDKANAVVLKPSEEDVCTTSIIEE